MVLNLIESAVHSRASEPGTHRWGICAAGLKGSDATARLKTLKLVAVNRQLDVMLRILSALGCTPSWAAAQSTAASGSGSAPAAAAQRRPRPSANPLLAPTPGQPAWPLITHVANLAAVSLRVRAGTRNLNLQGCGVAPPTGIRAVMHRRQVLTTARLALQGRLSPRPSWAATWRHPHRRCCRRLWCDLAPRGQANPRACPTAAGGRATPLCGTRCRWVTGHPLRRLVLDTASSACATAVKGAVKRLKWA